MCYSALADLPTSVVIYFLLDSVGRRRSIVLSLGLLGSCCVAMAFVPKDQSVAMHVLYMAGKFGSSCR